MNAVLTALVNGLIVSAVMTAALWFITKFVSKRSWNAATRYAVWWAALLITVAMPLLYKTGRPKPPSTNESHDAVAAAGTGNDHPFPHSDQIQSVDNSAAPRALAVFPPLSQTTPAPIGGVVMPLFPIEIAIGRWAGW